MWMPRGKIFPVLWKTTGWSSIPFGWVGPRSVPGGTRVLSLGKPEHRNGGVLPTIAGLVAMHQRKNGKRMPRWPFSVLSIAGAYQALLMPHSLILFSSVL